MGVISRRNQVVKGFRLGGLRTLSLLFTYDVVLLALGGGLQLPLERFATKCEVVGMRISMSKSKAMVLSQKRLESPVWVSAELLPQVEQFKYLGVLFTRESRRDREIDR